VHRLALLLLLVGACDLAFSVDEVVPIEAPCGPYKKTTPITIKDVTDPRSFSVSGDLAMVVGRAATGEVRPIPLHLVGDAWEPDPDFQAGLSSLALVAANLAPFEPAPNGMTYPNANPLAPVMMAATGTPLAVARYYWSGSTWSLDTIQVPVSDPSFDLRPGNVVLKASTVENDRVRHTVISYSPRDPALDVPHIQLYANTPPSWSLLLKAVRTAPLNNDPGNFGQAVLTDDQAKLVYSLTTANADIYASAQSPARDFGPGTPLDDTVNTSDDEVEPWIDGTCSKLYFRRIPQGQPNAAGTIFVAE
jgi:hypothetical protein